MAINKVVYGSETLIDLTEDTATADTVAEGYTLHLANGTRTTGAAKYAAAPVAAGNAVKSNGILYGAVDSTSTATAYTATIDGLTELYDGVTIMLHNGVVTSASGFTVNVNGLGAKKCYSNLTNATQETTIFNVAYTMMFVYSEALDDGNGGWWVYRGYDSNTNTIGYQLRTNATTKKAKDRGYRYRLWFTSADDTMWVPANISTSTNATAERTANTTPIDPFGPIIYTSHNTTYQAGAELNAGYQWTQYTIALGYSFTDSLPLTDNAPVYVKCLPQTDGSAVMQGTVEALPTTADGFIYIYLGQAYSTTNIELRPEHPVYWHDGTGIRLWTGAEPSGDVDAMTDAEIEVAVDAGWVVLISFYIGGTTYQAEEDMTWGEWVASSYNTDGYQIINGEVRSSSYADVIYNGNPQTSDIAIIANANYVLTTGGSND